MRDKGCYVRAAPGLFGVFDAGLQLIGNRFLKSPDTFEAAYPLRVMQCVACEMLQMREPFPVEELLPAYDWVTYIELEDHLDELAETMCALPGIGPEPVVAGVSFKDYTTLDRLTRLCVKHRWRLDLREHLLLDWVNGGHGAETLQAHLTEDAAWCIAARRGALAAAGTPANHGTQIGDAAKPAHPGKRARPTRRTAVPSGRRTGPVGTTTTGDPGAVVGSIGARSGVRSDDWKTRAATSTGKWNASREPGRAAASAH